MNVFKTFFSLIILISLFTSCNPSNSEQKTINDRSDDNYLEISRDIFNNLMLVKGEVVYVPVYSEIYTDLNKKTKLAATLSIRNTDMKNEIIVSMADYYDTHGNPIRNYIKSPVKLKPLQTVNYLVEYKEAKGGTGANFIVEWASEIEVTEPIIEAVMIGTSSSLGISFVCEGRVIKYVTD